MTRGIVVNDGFFLEANNTVEGDHGDDDDVKKTRPPSVPSGLKTFLYDHLCLK